MIYYGTKKIKATPMTRQEYNDYREWELPEDENGADTGYLVEYLDGGKPNHRAHDGYISWSPSEVFDRAYRHSGSLGFGHALEALKEGERVARVGWNGKGMFLFAIPLNEWDFVPRWSEVEGLDHLPFIAMKTADNKLVPWLCSQTDALAEDWCIV